MVKNEKTEYYYDNLLNEFENLNTTTENIYELGQYDVLIILKDGSNYTDYNLVNDFEDIIFISENIQNDTDLIRKYKFPNLKALIVQNINATVTKLDYMFFSCYSLETLVGLEKWDVKNITSMQAMFKNCFSLSNISFMKDWNVSNVMDMSYMFEDCPHLSDLSTLKSWNVSNLENMDSMFRDCTGLINLEELNMWNLSNVKSMNKVFENCHNLIDAEAMLNWNIPSDVSVEDIFRGCTCLSDYDTLLGGILKNNNISELSTNNTIEENIVNDEDMATTVLNQGNADGFLDLSDDLNVVMKVLDKIF